MAVALLCFLVPVALLFVKEKVPLASRWSPLVASYAAGLVLGNLGLLPEGAAASLDLASSIAVIVAIPLLLLSTDLSAMRRLGGKAGLSFALAAFAAALMASVGHAVLRGVVPESWKVAGMLVGVYTGGTPNLAAIRTALEVDRTTYLGVHTADLALGALYILAAITFLPKVLRRLLPVRGAIAPDLASGVGGEAAGRTVEDESFTVLFEKGTPPRLALALGFTVLAVGAAMGLSMLVPKEWETMTVILAVTTFSLLGSLSPRLRNIPRTFKLGEYFLLVFCVAVGAMADLSLLAGAAAISLVYVAIAMFGAFLLHAALAALFRIDGDTMLVTSVSAICSPPFVGLVATSMKRRDLILPGITTGILGYAIGNYLGIALAQALRVILP